MKPRLLFFGTPEFALEALRALHTDGRYEIVGVVTQTDKPSGRGQKLVPSPVKSFALEQGITVLQPGTLKNLKFLDGTFSGETEKSAVLASSLNALLPLDLAVVIAYGKIVPSAILDAPRLGAINVHGSILPRWRGAAPIQRALEAGDSTTGISIMKLDPGLDTGPVYTRNEIAIDEDETFGTLHDKMAELGAKCLTRDLPDILTGRLTAIPQSDSGVTYAEKWNAEDATIRWEQPALMTRRRIAASNPHPGARTTLDGETVKIFRARLSHDKSLPKAPCGSIVEVNRAEIIVATGTDDYIIIDELQFPGKRRLSTEEVLRGKPIRPGAKFN